MPHPLHNFKINGKMKRFTAAPESSLLRIKLYLFFLFSSFVFFNNAFTQTCNFKSSPPDTIVAPLTAMGANLGRLEYIKLSTELQPACDTNMVITNNLFWKDPNDGTIKEVRNAAGPMVTTAIHVSCDRGRTFTRDTISSGTIVRFYSAVDHTHVDTQGVGVDSINVTLVVDDEPPIFTEAPDVSIDCLADTTPGIGKPTGFITNVVDFCSGVMDTTYKSTTNFINNQDTTYFIERVWVVSDSIGNMTVDTQRIIVRDCNHPYWDTAYVNASGAVAGPLQRDSICWYGVDTMLVFWDTNGINNSNFWVNIYEPAAVDSCLGSRDTLSSNNVFMFYSDTTKLSCGPILTGSGATKATHAVLQIERWFYAKDNFGNIRGDRTPPVDSSSFVLRIFVIDSVPPVVIDTPFVGKPDVIRLDKIGVNALDTFVVDNTKDSCGAFVAPAAIKIAARDTFSKDSILYAWKVRTLLGDTPPSLTSPGFPNMTSRYDTASQYYPVGIHEITYLFSDSTGCMNRDSFKFVLMVRDTQNTQITYAPNPFVNDSITLNTTILVCSEALNWVEPVGTHFINCIGVPLTGVQIERKLVSGPDLDVFDGFPTVPNGGPVTGIFPVGTTVFRYIFRDRLLEADSIDFTVIVTDTEKPIAVCPGDQILAPDPMTCMVRLPDYTKASMDNCGITSAVQMPDTGSFIMTDTMVKIVVTDASGNKDSCSFKVMINLLAPVPLLNPLRDTFTQCDEIELVAPKAVVNCTDTIYAVTLGGTPSSTTPNAWVFSTTADTLTVVWFFTRNSTLISQTQGISFRDDTTPPVLNCPASVVNLSLDSLGSVVVSATDLGVRAMDNCSPVDSLQYTYSVDTLDCDSLNRPAFSVKVVVADEENNEDSCEVTVLIIDTRPPDFIGIPNDTLISCAEPLPALPAITVRDNCTMPVDPIRVDTINTQDTSGGALAVRNFGYYNYNLIYKWTAEDAEGNEASDSVIYMVRDTLPPNIPYPDTMYVSSAPDATTCFAKVTLNLQQDIVDNCSDTVYTFVNLLDGAGFRDTSAIMFDVPMGEKTIFVSARDRTGNINFRRIVIIVDDKTPPRPVCVNAISVSINPLGYVVLDSSDINMGSSDNCTVPNRLQIKLDRDTFRCADVNQTFTVRMTVIDEAGNFAGCSSQVTIQDFTGAGAFMCPNDTVIGCGTSLRPEELGFPRVMDVCNDNESLTWQDDTIPSIGGNCITIERTWTARDSTGNPTNCIQIINIIDNIAPSLSATFADQNVNCVGDAITMDTLMMLDNCAPSRLIVAKDTAVCTADNIIYTRIWTASDGCNIIADTQVIRIFDNVAPVIGTPTLTYNTGDVISEPCGVIVNYDFAPDVTDCNAQFGLMVRHSGPGGDTSSVLSAFFEVGVHTITVTAKDSCQNTSSRTIILNINDTSIPTAICITDINLSLGTGGMAMLPLSSVDDGSFDNCGGTTALDTMFLSKNIFNCSDLGLNEITLTVVDSSGNSNSCISRIVVVNDGVPNTININATATDESSAGVQDGTAQVSVTGGSGNYTYLWNDPNNSTTATISNLAPALYSVTVSDVTTGCRLTDTVRVNQGALTTIIANTVAALPGTTLQIPITVRNFNNIASLDMSFIISNPSVAVFASGAAATGAYNLTGMTTGNFTSTANTVNLSWSLPSGQPQTKADDETIFVLNVEVLGSLGDMTPIIIDGFSSATIEVAANVNNTVALIPSTSINGAVIITNEDSQVAFGGNIMDENGVVWDSVSVYLTGGRTDSTMTNLVGDYSFMLTTGQNYTIKPQENRNPVQGVSTLDLVLIQQHILAEDTLDSPYKIIAADANRSGVVSTLDLVELQFLILGETAAFQNNTSWRFIPKSHVFVDPLNPIDPMHPFPEQIDINNLVGPFNDADFVGLKVGDVNNSAMPIFLQGNNPAEPREMFYFELEDRLLQEGALIELPFKANNFTEMLGYQMTLKASMDWLELENVTANDLEDISMHNFGLSHAEEGFITTNWYKAKPLTVEQGATLFTLSFRVQQGGKYLSEILEVGSEITHAEAYDSENNIKDIGLRFSKNGEAGFELFQNRPNPFSKTTVISFNLPKATPATVKFYDFSGRLIHQVKGIYDKGYNELSISRSDLSSTGVLYYEIETPTHTGKKKMILIE